MSEFRDSARILNWFSSFHIFLSCANLLYLICHAGSVIDLLHCNLGELVWCTQFKTKGKEFIFCVVVFSRETFETWPGNSCFAFRKRSLGFNFFLNLFSQQFKVWLKHSQDVYLIFVYLFSRGMQLLLAKRYYNRSFKGEKYQLDLSKLLVSSSDCFLSQSKYFDQLSYRKTKQNQK